MKAEPTLRTCKEGHQFLKSTDCPTCPVCEAAKKPADGFLSLLAAPARRAMINHQIFTLDELARYSEQEVMKFHGLGKASIPVLKKALNEQGLSFKS